MITEQEEGNCAPKWEGLEPQGMRQRVKIEKAQSKQLLLCPGFLHVISFPPKFQITLKKAVRFLCLPKEGSHLEIVKKKMWYNYQKCLCGSWYVYFKGLLETWRQNPQSKPLKWYQGLHWGPSFVRVTRSLLSSYTIRSLNRGRPTPGFSLTVCKAFAREDGQFCKCGMSSRFLLPPNRNFQSHRIPVVPGNQERLKIFWKKRACQDNIES